jgi:hypothetical protein
MVPPDNIQQASDLADGIKIAATNLVNVVEAQAIIRPGVTERTLQDLQLTLDILEETAREVEEEPVTTPYLQPDGATDRDMNDASDDTMDDTTIDGDNEGTVCGADDTAIDGIASNAAKHAGAGAGGNAGEIAGNTDLVD